MTATIRTITHLPTGRKFTVQQINFRDNEIIAGRVTGTNGLKVTQHALITVPLSECSRPVEEKRTPELLRRLFVDGATDWANANDRDIRFGRRGAVTTPRR